MKSAALRRFYEATGFTVMRAAVLINIAALLGIIGLIGRQCLAGDDVGISDGTPARSDDEGRAFCPALSAHSAWR